MSLGKKILNIGAYILLFLSFTIAATLITFTMEVKGRKIYVPKLTGIDVKKAENLVKQMGVCIKVIASREEEGIPGGIILSQNPYPGFEIKKGGEIQVVVSQGEEGVEIPDFRGKKLEAVRMEMQDLNLELGKVTQIFSPSHDPSVVLAQVPVPGKKVAKNSYVDLLVSEPSQESFVMPDFIGKEFDVVDLTLRELGFKVSPPELVSYPGWEAGIIIKQLPFPGYKINKNQIISFKVTK